MSTFDFGYGPVPAHQHPNGGGWVADTVSVANSAYIGPNARVYGGARVSGNARVYGGARVSGNAWVFGKCEKTPTVISAWNFTLTIIDDSYYISNNLSLSDLPEFCSEAVRSLLAKPSQGQPFWEKLDNI